MRGSASGSQSPPASVRRQRAGSILSSGDHRDQLLRALNGASVCIAPGTELAPTEQYRLLEYMCVCGFASRDSGRPTALARVPADARVSPVVPTFSFGEGVPPIPSTVCAALADGADCTRYRGDTTFMTTIATESGATQYVYIVRTWETFQNPPPWFPVGAVRCGSLLGGVQPTMRAYCIVSFNPYARLFWALLWELVRLERERITTDSDERRARLAKRQVHFCDKIVATVAKKIYQPDSLIRLESEACFAQRVIEFRTPPSTQGPRVSVAAVCLPVLMRAMSPANIVKLMTAALCESKVIVVARQPGRVAACVLAVAAAVAPFTWQCTMVPIVPESLLEILDAPTPVLVGRVAAAGTELPASVMPTDARDRLVVANVDTNSVAVHGRALPELPYAGELCSSLAASHAWLRAGMLVMNDMCEDPRPFVPTNERQNTEIMSAIEALAHWTVWLIDALRRHLDGHCYPEGASPSSPRSSALLLMRVHPEHADFVHELVNTQHYAALAATFADMPPPEEEAEGVNSL